VLRSTLQGFFPSVAAYNPLLGVWGFIVGSAFIGWSQVRSHSTMLTAEVAVVDCCYSSNSSSSSSSSSSSCCCCCCCVYLHAPRAVPHHRLL
jgi:hypothetical protein